ncbi:MAG: penicillin-binding protein 1A [Flavobacteriales bacterium]
MTENNPPENMPEAKAAKHVNWTTRIIRYICIGATLPFVIIILGLLFASWGWFGPLPDIEDIEHPENNFATEVISADGNVLGKYYHENRTPVSYNELSPHLVNALIATEDKRYYEHSGVDGYGLGRAVVKKMMGKNAGGASTITQQLAKMLFTKTASKSALTRITQKFQEWLIAAKLERHYTKEEIIAMYFNKFDFLYQAVGIKSAAKIYFDKNQQDLTIDECAILVAMAKNPSLYNPLRREKNSINRRNTVLMLMEQNGYITAEERQKYRALPMKLTFQRQSVNTGLSTYFREYLRQELKNWAKNTKKPSGEPYNIYTDGLKIYTTIDSRIQRYAEEAVAVHNKDLQKQMYAHQKKRKTAPWPWDYSKKKIADNMEREKKRSERYRKARLAKLSDETIDSLFITPTKMRLYTMNGIVDTVLSPMDSILHNKYLLHHSMMSMDPQTGFIKAWVGGINHEFFKYDNVKTGKRQIGSTFKPFVYATAIDQLKFSPCQSIPDVPVTFEKEDWNIRKDWTPKNSDGKYGGERTLKNALANSVNSVTAFLMKKVGPKEVIKNVRKMGISAEIPVVPSICLGTPDISLYEMVGAYGTFANKGIYTEPIFMTRIEDRNGTILYQYEPKTEAVFSEEKAYVMLDLMKGVSKEGTGVRLKYKYKLYNPIAGKTGTTQNNMDGWFIGMVPNLVTGVWTGCQDPAIRFSSTRYGQGANMALPIWAELMQRVYADESLDISKSNFERPSFKLSIETDCDKFNNVSDEDENYESSGNLDEVF